MCRLYGFRANEATKVECTLVYAQNALMVQSREDLAGTSHVNGWGVATYNGQTPHVERQAWAAYHGENFRQAAARIFAHQVLAHVRRATIGAPRIENTHPFVDGPWALIHNGTVPNFDRLRPRMLAAMPAARRRAIRGDTDSEHVFHYLRSLHEAAPERKPIEILRQGLRQVVSWCREIDPGTRIGLNVILTNGDEMVGSRLGRTLYYVERDNVHDCEVCGFPHVRHDAHRQYRSVIVASEPISGERWQDVPEGSIYRVSENFGLEIEPL